jgi:[CysO sulfur-carrier protein]-S-L-cysteine hydrolase
MTDQALLLPRHLVQQLFHLAQASPGSEICGLISAANGSPHRCYPVANVSGDPAHLFDMDAQGQVQALRDMRERGETLFAIYHSHPYAPPEPSARDREYIGYPEACYLIISLNTKGVLEMRAWQAEGDALQERPLKIIRD